MSDLSPDDRDLLRRGADGDLPNDDDRDRIRSRLARRLGAGAGLGAASVATKTGVAAAKTGVSLGIKIMSAALVVSALGGGAAAVSLRAKSPTSPSARELPTASMAWRGAPAVPTPTASTAAREPSEVSEPPPPSPTAPTTPTTNAPTSSAPTAERAPTTSTPTSKPTGLARRVPAATSVPSAATDAETKPLALRPSPGGTEPFDVGGAPPVREVSPGATPALGTLAEETVLLREANAAIAAKNPQRALALLDEHARRFPSGALAEERDAERVIALCAASRTADAQEAAARFLRDRPHSPLAGRVRKSCAASP